MAKKTMPKVRVHRYDVGNAGIMAGFIEPADKRWILFITEDGAPILCPHRDPVTGAVLPDAPAPTS